MRERVTVSAAVEGIVDEAVARRLITHVGGFPGPVYGKNGKHALRQKIAGYNHAARWGPWLVLVDLDREADCAPPLCRLWLPSPSPLLCFRVAVRQVEAWLIADANALARYLHVAPEVVPTDPDAQPDAKREMVDLARRSRRRAIREDMAPRPGSGRVVGPAYGARLIEFASTRWRPGVAAQRSPSLRRAITCLERLLERVG